MLYENKGTELQIRELMRRCMYLDASIYSNTKPLPFIPKPAWFKNGSYQLQIMLEPVENIGELRAAGVSGMRKFGVTISLQGIPNKAAEYANVNTQVKLIDNNGRSVQWSIEDASAWLNRATFNTWFSAIITVQWGEFMAGRWNSARSGKLAGQFLALPDLTVKAQTYRDKAALIVSDESQRALDLIGWAQNLEAAAVFGTAIVNNDF